VDATRKQAEEITVELMTRNRRRKGKRKLSKEGNILLGSFLLLLAGILLSVLTAKIESPLATGTCCTTIFILLFVLVYGFFTNRHMQSAGFWILRDIADDHGAGYVVDHVQTQMVESRMESESEHEIVQDSGYGGNGSEEVGTNYQESDTGVTCPTCRQFAPFVKEYSDYYCYNCQQYLNWYDDQ
jgi:hypothetical protein